MASGSKLVIVAAQQIEHDVAEIDAAIKKQYPQIKRVFIESEKRHNRHSQSSQE